MSDEDWAVPINTRRARAGLPEFEQATMSIPLANLHRLDLKPGESLAVIAPDGITSVEGFKEFGRSITDVFDELEIHVVVFPPGTKLNVVAPSTD